MFKATTSSTGKYTIADLPSGTYEVTAAAPALRPFEKKGVAVEPSQTASSNSPGRHHAAQHAG